MSRTPPATTMPRIAAARRQEPEPGLVTGLRKSQKEESDDDAEQQRQRECRGACPGAYVRTIRLRRMARLRDERDRDYRERDAAGCWPVPAARPWRRPRELEPRPRTQRSSARRPPSHRSRAPGRGRATPVPPVRPARAPQKSCALVGADAGRRGNMTSNSRRPANCDTTTAASVLARFAVRPPRKSAAP